MYTDNGSQIKAAKDDRTKIISQSSDNNRRAKI